MLRNPNDLQMVMITHLATDLFLVCAAGSVLGMVYFDSDLEEDLLQTISLSCLVVRPQPHTFFHATPAATTERHCQAPVLTRTVPQQLLLPPPHPPGWHDGHYVVATLVLQGGSCISA